MVVIMIILEILEEIFVRILLEISVELFIFILNIIDKLFLNKIIDR